MRVTVLFAVMALLAACSTTASTTDARLECTTDSRTYFVTHPWICLRDGGEIVEAPSAPSDWVVEAVKVKWQGRDAITSGHFYYNRFGNRGEMRLDLPEAGDSCYGPYRLHSFGDADWSAACDSGLKTRVTVFLDTDGVSASGHGKDSEGRNFGFFQKQEG